MKAKKKEDKKPTGNCAARLSRDADGFVFSKSTPYALAMAGFSKNAVKVGL